MPAICAPTFSASSNSLSLGTTRLTRPLRSASAASIMRPVNTISIALALPTARVSRCVPPEPGMIAERDLGLAEFGAFRGDDGVAHHRHLAAAAEREARDRGDDRLAAGGDALPAIGDEILEVAIDEALARPSP